MTSLSTAEARGRFADVINRAAYGKERVVLTRRGQELVAVIPIEDLQFLQEMEDRLDIEAAMAALAEVEEKGTIPWEQIEAEIGR